MKEIVGGPPTQEHTSHNPSTSSTGSNMNDIAIFHRLYWSEGGAYICVDLLSQSQRGPEQVGSAVTMATYLAKK